MAGPELEEIERTRKHMPGHSRKLNAELFRRVDAARAQGFGHSQVFRLIALPQVLRRSVPALTNQVILNLKDSAIAFLIQYTEFFARVQELAATNFQFFKAYLLAALVYLSLVAGLVWLARRLERRWALPA